MRTIARFDNQFEAHLVKGLLENEQIPVLLVGQHFFEAQYRYVFALGEIRLRVPADYLAEAQQVLKAYHQGEYEEALIQELGIEKHTCNLCGGNTFKRVGSGILGVLGALLQVYFFSLVLSYPKYEVCNSCGNKTRIN